MSEPLRVVPCTLRQANAFVNRCHRTHKPEKGCKCVFAIGKGKDVVGVVIVGRPKARRLDDGLTSEVTRCCTDGTFDACSFGYARAWVAARAIGYRRLITYTLPSEGGPALRALKQQGWKRVEDADGQPLLFGGGEWTKPSRHRELNCHPSEKKWRWEVSM